MRSCGGGWDVESGAGPKGKHVQEWMGRALSGHPAIQGACQAALMVLVDFSTPGSAPFHQQRCLVQLYGH